METLTLTTFAKSFQVKERIITKGDQRETESNYFFPIMRSCIKERGQKTCREGKKLTESSILVNFCLLAIWCCLTHFFPNFILKVYPSVLGLYDYGGADFIAPSFLAFPNSRWIGSTSDHPSISPTGERDWFRSGTWSKIYHIRDTETQFLGFCLRYKQKRCGLLFFP